MAGIDGLNAGDLVTAEQMLALFGSGHHPLAEQRKRDLAGPGLAEKDYLEITRLGEPFRVYSGDISPFRVEVARRLEALNKERGLPQKAATAIEDRARIRSQVALEMFRNEYGRGPLNERELAGHVAKLSRQQTTAVAGFDLTFSPVKSVSTLWALADPALAAAIERCHQQAVADALAFIETHALFTRTGTDGVRQSTSAAWSAPRSPTATAGPETPTCTPMSRWRTRSRPSPTDGGCRSTAGCFTRPL